MKKRCLMLSLACGSLLLHACGGGSAPPIMPTQLVINSISANATAGASVTITVTAADSAGNLASTYSGTLHFTSSDPQATFQPSSSPTLTNGTGNCSVTFKTAGGQSVSVTGSVTNSTNVSITINGGASYNVNPGPVTQLTVTPAVPAATVSLATNVTVVASDAYMNQATTYAGTVQLTSTDTSAVFQPSSSTLTNGVGNFVVTFKTIGPQTITAADTVNASLKNTSSSVNVVSNAPTHLSLSAPVNINTRATFNFVVTALDAAENTSLAYAGTVKFTSNDTSAHLPANTTFTAGVSPSVSATMETAGAQTLTATDTASASLNGSSSISVATVPDLTVAPAVPPAGTVGAVYHPYTVTICLQRIFLRCVRQQIFSVNGFTLVGGGGVPPYSWSWAPAAGSAVPPGLSVYNQGNASCPIVFSVSNHPACIHGVPTQPGTYNVVLTVTDSGLPSVSTPVNYAISIAKPAPPVVNTTPPPPPAVQGQPYTFTFTGTGYPPLTWSESGAVPGLTFNPNTQILSGTPTQPGSFPISVTATDQFAQASTPADFTIVVSAHGFQASGPMTTPRTLHTATMLQGGKVLVAGGQLDPNNLLASTELFDPNAKTFTASGNMQSSRSQHTSILLNDGRVLLAGGSTGTQGSAVATAELFDSTGATSTATAGLMQVARYGHTATLLGNGNVLIIGGADATGTSLSSAELFNPSTGMFTKTGSMQSARRAHTATLLADGTVLVAGGIDATSKDLATAEIYNLSNGTFTPVTGMMTVTRANHTATLFTSGPDSGKVLLAGGLDDAGAARNTAELFDPTAKSFTATTNLTTNHSSHTATLLTSGPDAGKVLLVGGIDSTANATAVVELFDPTSGNFAASGSLVTAREQHTSTFLASGHVLVTGGTNGTALSSAEVYQ